MTVDEPRRVGLYLSVLLVLSLGINLIIWHSDPFSFEPRDDSMQYHLLAKNLLEHQTLSLDETPPYTPSARRQPAYPIFVAAIYGASSPDVQCPKLAQAILFLLVPALSFFLAKFVCPQTSIMPLIVASIVAFSPSILTTFFRLRPEPLLMISLLTIPVFFQLWLNTKSHAWSVLMGLALAMCGLLKPEAMLLFVPVSLAAILTSRGGKFPWLNLLILCLIPALFQTIWAYRNSLSDLNITGVVLDAEESSRAGHSMFREYRLRSEYGVLLRPERYKYFYGEDWKAYQKIYLEALQAGPKNPDEGDIEYFLNRPKELSKYLFIKLYGLFKPRSWGQVVGVGADFSAAANEREYLSLAAKGALLIFDFLFIALGFIGAIALLWNKNQIKWVLLMIPLYSIAVYSVIHGIARYRLLFPPIWVLFAVYAVYLGYQRYFATPKAEPAFR